MIAVFSGSIPKNYTALTVPFYVNTNEDEVHYWAISDGKYNLPPWRDLTVKRDYSLSSRRQFVQCKLQSHKLLPDYDYVIWLDAAFKLLVDPVNLVDYLHETGDTMVFGKHPWRECLYDEAIACERKADPKIMADQISRYRAEGYPEHNGLAATTFFIRDNKDPKTCELFDFWLNEVEKGCCRTQISFDYSIWKLGMSYRRLNIKWGNTIYYTSNPPIEKDPDDVMFVKGIGTPDERGFLLDLTKKVASEFGPNVNIVNIGILYGASCHVLRMGAPEAKLYGVDVNGWSRILLDRATLKMELIQGDSRETHTQYSEPTQLIFVDGGYSYGVAKSDILNWVIPNVVVGGYAAFHNACYIKGTTNYKECEGVRIALEETMDTYHNWRRADKVDSIVVYQRMS